MSLIPVNYGQANFQFAGAGLPNGAECVMGFGIGAFVGTPTDAAEELGNAWVDNIIPFQNSEISIVNVHVKYGPNETGPDGDFPLAVAGGDSGEIEGPQVAVLVRKHTNDGGRAGRGRLYLPGIRNTRVETGGNINGTFVTDLAAAFNSFLVDVEAVMGSLVVLHNDTTPYPLPSVIQTFSVDSQAATQRRRCR